MFENLIWKSDRMLLDDLIFRLEPSASADPNIDDQCFRFYKGKALVDEYAAYWTSLKSFTPKNVFELGIWDGGSTAFWFEHLKPSKHVAIDVQDKQDSDYFTQYISSRGVDENIKTYWRVNQADHATISQILAAEFTDPLDLVIDDASHFYGPTKQSFETLFPLLRPGGIYIIEDWAWAHWNGMQVGRIEDEPTTLIFELIEALGTSQDLMKKATVFRGFIALERGPMDLRNASFQLQNHIHRSKVAKS
jgi:cephalosporin hydroxylase